MVSGPFGGFAAWSGDSEPDGEDAPAWRPEAAGPEYRAFADAAAGEHSSSASGDMIVTNGAARAIEKGERVEALKLTLFKETLALEAPDHVWFHIVNELSTNARAGCASCRELTEVLARVLFSL